ncbi:LysR substrate-binding domain-containing protein [Kribbella sp. NPDC056861]|uniref:LysR substrate-binding domain-containing protein n=1 Tax=Kribbella sp. NPDC056861 TaxID=3154857 RepID=UPI00343CA081
MDDEFDLGDPTAGLRTGACDVALTRCPSTPADYEPRLARQSIGLVVRDDDPLAHATSVRIDQLSERSWICLPPDTDVAWVAYWTGLGARPADVDQVMRTIQECLHAVLWNGQSALAPVDQLLPAGLIVVPAEDRKPNDLVLAWRETEASPLIRSFVEVACQVFARALHG